MGVKSKPKSMTPSIPGNTATPRTRRSPEPAPVARASGTTPRMKLSEVMRIGLRRRRLASIAASNGGLPMMQLALFGKFHDENGILAGQADQHDKTNLREQVVNPTGEGEA